MKWPLVAAVAAAWAAYGLDDGHDFGVYYETATALFEKGEPIYGRSHSWYPLHRESVWGHIPGAYRYPPFFLFLIWPLQLLPAKVAYFVWTAGKVVCLYLLSMQIARRLSALGRRPHWLAACFVLPYLVAEFRSGNVEFYIGALTAAALLVVERRPQLAGAMLGLGVAIKIWPLFFVPYLVALGYRRAVVPCLAAAAIFTALPTFYFGPVSYGERLAEWHEQESAIARSLDEPWFRSVSIRGAMMRHLTDVEYEYPDPNYPHVNSASLEPKTVYWTWLLIDVALYAGLLGLARRAPERFRWDLHGAAFCLLVLMQPNPHRLVPASLVLPALAASSGWRGVYPNWGRWCFAAAAAVVVSLPFVGSEMNRLLVTLGADPLAFLLATAALVSPIARSGLAKDLD